MTLGAELIVGASFVVLTFLTYWLVMRTLYQKVGPDEALIVYGRKQLFGTKMQTNAGVTAGFRIVSPA